MSRSDTPEKSRRSGILDRRLEPFVYIALLVLVNLFYIYSAFLSGESRFGFDQLRHLGPPAALALYAGFALVLLVRPFRAGVRSMLYRAGSSLPDGRGERNRIGRMSLYAAVSLASLGLFLLLHNNFINCDGLGHLENVPRLGRCLGHDEMWTSLTIERAWAVMNDLLGWSVKTFYHVWSSVMGALFVFVLLLFTERRGPSVGRWMLVLLIASAGFMQLFFGDVENYAAVAFLIMCYLFAGIEHLRGRISIVLPSVLLATATMFHLLAGWLLPSLVYLYWRSFRSGRRLQCLLAAVLSILVVLLTLVVMETSGLHMISIRRSHFMGTADSGILDMLGGPDATYYVNLMNLLFLLFPAVWAFLPMLLFRRFERSPSNTFLMIGSAMLLLLLLLWRAGLGPYHDWNLYASLGIPLSLLLWLNFLRAGGQNGMRFHFEIALAILFTSAIHSYSWIVSNHLLREAG